MSHQNYRIFLADSATPELTTVADITRAATSKQLTLAANQAGTFSFNLNTTFEWAQYLIPVRYCVVVMRNNDIVWSGPIWTIGESFHEQQIEIGCVGWLEILFHRYHIGSTVTYTTTNAGAIAFNLLDLANTNHDTWISQGENTNTQTRTFTIESYENIGQHIQQLTEVENGIDIEIDPATRAMNVYAADDFNVSDAHFGYNIGTRNLKTFTRETDAGNMANQWYARGKVSVAEAHDDTSITQYDQKLQEVISLTDITDVTLLGAIANAELAVNAHPRVLYNFVPKADAESTLAQVFDDYNLRDEVTVSAGQDNVAEVVGHPTRVFGFTIQIDDAGNEIVSNIQVTYQAA